MSDTINIRITGPHAQVNELVERLELVCDVLYSTNLIHDDLTYRDIEIKLTPADGWGISFRPAGFTNYLGKSLPSALVVGGPAGSVVVPLDEVQKLRDQLAEAADRLTALEAELSGK